MEESLSIMETCVRVLKAVNARQDPDPRDVRALREYAAGEFRGLGEWELRGLDELACAVIQKALKLRADSRESIRQTRTRVLRDSH